MQNIPHIPVLYKEVIETFERTDTGIVIDCTLGYGGHTSMLLEANPHIKMIGIDQDQTAIDFSMKRVAPFGERISIKKGRFSKIIEEILQENNKEDIQGILADIGVSSLQLDHKERGFSYESQTLDMRMDQEALLTASDVINSYSEEQLADIIYNYGELGNSKKIAASIVANRPFHSAQELAQKTKHLLPQGKKIHPATLLMQAIRIEVNSELKELESLLQTIKEARLPHAKIAIISFHSLEDRIVKQTFASWAKSCICPDEAFRCTCGNNHALGKVISKKPITAEQSELKQNPRSRSAKMRVFQMDLHG